MYVISRGLLRLIPRRSKTSNTRAQGCCYLVPGYMDFEDKGRRKRERKREKEREKEKERERQKDRKREKEREKERERERKSEK